MNISNAVRQLLHRYDCVVIPGLGGFVSNYQAARIHPVQHKFYPPGKRITFNQLLQVNDGLLAHFMAQQSGKSYEHAMKSINEEVALWNKDLAHGKTVSVDGVGNFTRNREGHLVFEADSSENYLRESYGLTVFQSLPVSKKEGLRVVHSAPKQEVLSEVKSGFAWDRLANYSSAAAVISLIALTTFKLDLIGNDQLNRIGLNLFQEEASSYHSIEYPQMNAVTQEDKMLEQRIKDSDANYLEYAILDKKVVVNIEKAEKKEVVMTDAQGPYHVVAGCFGVESNATRLNKKLRKKGFSSQLPGLHNGLHVVSYGSFSDGDEARKLLSRVKKEENASAWILKK